jgi:hypothetical protein
MTTEDVLRMEARGPGKSRMWAVSGFRKDGNMSFPSASGKDCNPADTQQQWNICAFQGPWNIKHTQGLKTKLNKLKRKLKPYRVCSLMTKFRGTTTLNSRKTQHTQTFRVKINSK